MAENRALTSSACALAAALVLSCAPAPHDGTGRQSSSHSVSGPAAPQRTTPGRTGRPSPSPQPDAAASLSAIPAEALAERNAVWARVVHDFSSQYGTSQWSARQVLGAPDVYPRHGDIGEAWASLAPDGGLEWIEVGFENAHEIRAILIVQTFNPSAVIRVDDTTPEGMHRVLWEQKSGRRSAMNESAVLELKLKRPLAIRRVRVVLDTKQIAGWNELDAIGVIPAP